MAQSHPSGFGSATWLVVAGRNAVRSSLIRVREEAERAGRRVVAVEARASDGPFGLVRRIGAGLIGDLPADHPVFAGAGGFAWEQLGQGEVPAVELEAVIYGMSWLFLALAEENESTILLIAQADRTDPESQRVLEAVAGRAEKARLAIVAAGVPGPSGEVRRWARFTLLPTVPVAAPEEAEAGLPSARLEREMAELGRLAADSPERPARIARITRQLIEVDRPEDAAALAEREIEAMADRGLEADPELLVAAARASQLVISRRKRAVELTRLITSSGPDAGSPGSEYLGEIALERVNTVAAGRQAVVEPALAAVEPGRADPARLTDSLGWFFGCYALHLAEHNREALAVLDLAVAEAGRRRSLPDFVRAVALRSGPLFHLGYLREAAVDCELALAAGIGDLEVWLPAVRSTLIQLRAFMLDFEGAGRIIRDQGSTAGETATTMLFRFGRATLCRFAGRTGQALEDLFRAGELMDAGLGNNPAMMPWRAMAAITLVSRDAGGDRELAVKLADEELDLARTFGSPGPLGTALWARAVCEPDPGQQLERLREAVVQHRRGERMVERIEAELALGRALTETGRREEARASLRETLHLAHASGADLLVERIREALVAAGGKPRRSAASGVDSLTPSERRIVELAATGLTNREVAESLFLTMKTVEWHLTRAYAKLGVAGRDDLAAALDPPARGFRGAGGVDSFPAD